MQTNYSRRFSRNLWGSLSKAGSPGVDDQGNEGTWITLQGRAIFIREGESLDQATARAGMPAENKPAEAQAPELGRVLQAKLPHYIAPSDVSRDGVWSFKYDGGAMPQETVASHSREKLEAVAGWGRIQQDPKSKIFWTFRRGR